MPVLSNNNSAARCLVHSRSLVIGVVLDQCREFAGSTTTKVFFDVFFGGIKGFAVVLFIVAVQTP